MFLLPLNCNCSQVLHIRAGTFARYSPSIPANVTVRRWGACEQLPFKLQTYFSKENPCPMAH